MPERPETPAAHSRRRAGRASRRVLTAALLSATLGVAAALDPADRAQQQMQAAMTAIQDGRLSLARSYLDAVVISPWISPRQRARAYYFRGFSFFIDGLHVSAALDYARALEFDPGQEAALAALSHLYAQGLGLARNDAEAFRLALKAARAGHAHAKVVVGATYLNARERDVAKARYWLRSAAEDGHVPAYVHLARSFRAGIATEPEPATALAWYEKAEAAGVREASLAIGHMLRRGELGAPDPAAAARRFRALADAGWAPAQSALAHMYLVGDVGTTDFAAARRWYLKAAEQGDVAAYVGLAHLFESGKGVERDPGAAHRWYLEAAEAGHAPSQYHLGTVAYDADDLAATREALHWFEQAAAQSLPGAANNAAWILATSRFDAVRNGTKALAYAQDAVERDESASTLDTLAAAYAETGDYEQARAVQAAAVALASDPASAEHRELLEHRDRYENDTPWRE